MLRAAALFDAIAAVPPLERDAWVDALLGIDVPLPDDEPDLPRGVVPYLPCGVDEIVAMVRAVPLGPTHHLVDVGAGLGRMLFLAHLLSGARATGIELQRHLVDRARDRAVALGLDVEILHANAADVALEGDVFFLYSPCNGALLVRVLERLAEVARRHAIVVCGVGLEFGAVPWLAAREAPCPGVMLYDSRDRMA